jgi:hypothetical protein
LLPSSARLNISGVQSSEDRAATFDFWDSTSGFNFGAIKIFPFSEPLVDHSEDWAIATDCQLASEADLDMFRVDVAWFTGAFGLHPQRYDILDACVTWFDVFLADMPIKMVLSTAPSAPETHWKQTFSDLERASNGRRRCQLGNAHHATK